MADVKATRTDSRLCRPARRLVVKMVSSEWRRVDIYFIKRELSCRLCRVRSPAMKFSQWNLHDKYDLMDSLSVLLCTWYIYS